MVYCPLPVSAVTISQQSAAGVILHYVVHTQRDLTSLHISTPSHFTQEAHLMIDANTRRALELTTYVLMCIYYCYNVLVQPSPWQPKECYSIGLYGSYCHCHGIETAPCQTSVCESAYSNGSYNYSSYVGLHSLMCHLYTGMHTIL